MMSYARVLCVVLLLTWDCSANNSPRGRSTVRRSHQPRSNRRHLIAGSHRCESDITTSDDILEAFEKKLRDADFVFTGKVTSIVENREEISYLQVDGDGNDFALEKSDKLFSVRVKRALKGLLPGSLANVELTKPHTHQMVEVAVRKHGGQGKHRCYHVIRVHHTAIFMADREDNNGTLQLISNPLALTLRNLDRVNAAVKDMTFKPRAPIVEELCEKTFCDFGANCVLDSEGRTRCQCLEECPNVFTPVCGTDGITYENDCVLRRKACLGEIKARVQHSGLCGAPGTADRRRN